MRDEFRARLSRDPEDMFAEVRNLASQMGWSLSGGAYRGSFSNPAGNLTGSYEVQGNEVVVVLESDSRIMLAFAKRELKKHFS